MRHVTNNTTQHRTSFSCQSRNDKTQLQYNLAQKHYTSSKHTRECIYQMLASSNTRHTCAASPSQTTRKSPLLATCYLLQPSPRTKTQRHGHIQTHHARRRSNKTQWSSGVHEHSTRHAFRHIPKAQCAFKGLMIHEVLQFALRIAFRCVLHRCGSLDIRC